MTLPAPHGVATGSPVVHGGGSCRGLLREQQFRRFWIGQTISMFGDQVTGLALPIVAVLVLGADATQMGLLTAVGLLPHLLFSLPAGVWLDRVQQRRRLMILMDLGRAARSRPSRSPSASTCSSLPLLFAISFIVGTLSRHLRHRLEHAVRGGREARPVRRGELRC